MAGRFNSESTYSLALAMGVVTIAFFVGYLLSCRSGNLVRDYREWRRAGLQGLLGGILGLLAALSLERRWIAPLAMCSVFIGIVVRIKPWKKQE